MDRGDRIRGGRAGAGRGEASQPGTRGVDRRRPGPRRGNGMDGTGHVSGPARGLAVSLAGSGLTLRPLGSDQFQLLAGANGARNPFWSADGKNIAFLQDEKLKYVSASGGPAQELCSGVLGGGTWNQDNVILVNGVKGRLLKATASGGGCTPLPGDPAAARRNPYFLPDGKHFLYQGSPSGPDLAAASKTGVYVASLEDAASARRLL